MSRPQVPERPASSRVKFVGFDDKGEIEKVVVLDCHIDDPLKCVVEHKSMGV
jgi:hypothetical protein